MFSLILIGRAIHGWGSSCIFISGMTLIAETSEDDEERGKSMSIVFGGLSLGIILGYPFGAIMYSHHGKTLPFLIVASLAILELFVLIVVLSTSGSAHRHSSKGSSLITLLLDPYILLAAGTMLIPMMSVASLDTMLPAWMIDNLHPQQWQIGAIFLPNCVGFMVGTNLLGYLSFKIGRWLAIMSGLVLLSISLFCIPMAKEVIHLIAPYFVLGLSVGLVEATAFALLANLVETRHVPVYGCVFAIAEIVVSAACTIAPALGGNLIKFTGFSWLMRGLAFINFLTIPLCFILRRSTNTNGRRNAAMTSSTPYDKLPMNDEEENKLLSDKDHRNMITDDEDD